MTTSKSTKVQVTIFLVVTAFFVVHFLFLLLPNVFETWNAQTVDQVFVLRSRVASLSPPYDSTVIHVDLSDRSIESLRNFYLNRTHYAKVVTALAEAGAAAQVWDYIFPARTNEMEDSVFFDATAKAGNAYFGIAFRLMDEEPANAKTPVNADYIDYLKTTKWNIRVEGNPKSLYFGIPELVTLPDLARASKGLGYLSQRPDRDGVFRRTPLLLRYDGAYYPSFALRAICDYLKVPPENVVLAPGHTVTLKSAHKPDGTVKDIKIPIDKKANIIVNWVGFWDRMRHYDFAEVLAAADDRDNLDILSEQIKGSIVVVSEVSTGSADVRPVPMENEYPLSGLHANVLHTILSGNFLTELNDSQMVFLEVLLLVLVLILAMLFSSRGLWLSALVLLVSYLGGGILLFLYGNVIVNVIRPALMIIFSVFAIVAYRYINEEKEKESLRRSFEAYFPPTVVKKIMANPETIYAAGQKKELTVMFSDIKSFTTHSSTMSPEAIQKSLDEYFGAMVDIVFKYEGTVDKFIGDGLMVFYGDPEPQSDHALRCVKAAIEMQKKCREIKAKWETEGSFPLKIRIGINTGPVVVGNMGSSKRLSYTVLGSDVNLAQRLEANAPVEGIMISQRTYELVKDQVPTRPLEPIKVKGLDQPVHVYEVVVDGQAPN